MVGWAASAARLFRVLSFKDKFGMELYIAKNKFVCIDYPGVVVNTVKMLHTLGGEKNITKVITVVVLSDIVLVECVDKQLPPFSSLF